MYINMKNLLSKLSLVNNDAIILKLTHNVCFVLKIKASTLHDYTTKQTIMKNNIIKRKRNKACLSNCHAN